MATITSDDLTFMGRRPRHCYQTRAEAAAEPQTVRFSPQERAIVKAASKLNRQTVSEFVREASIAAAYDCLEPLPKFEGG